MHIVRRNTCRACGSKSLTKVIHLGEQYLQGSFVKEGVVTPPVRRLPMSLVRCNPMEDENACGLLQAEFTVPPEMMYQTYWYRSGTNATMRNHLHGIVHQILGAYGTPGRVLDIGCNDGTLLSYYPNTVQQFGVDPSSIAGQQANGEGRTIVNDFFPSPAATLAFDNNKFDVVTAIAMFYDLEKPADFVAAVREVLTPEGVFVFEMSHMPAMLRTNSYDTICHEHLEYYSLAAIEKILRQSGMRVIRVSENSINGGSIRCTAVKSESSKRADDSVAKVRTMEFDLELDTDAPYLEFQKRADVHRKDLLSLLKRLKNDDARIHLYGASTKGNTLLQWCNIDWRLVEAAADRNEDKWGAKTPGTEIPIISEEKSRAMRPDYYLVLPWHFKEEFVEREKLTLASGTKFIFPLPQISIVGV